MRGSILLTGKPILSFVALLLLLFSLALILIGIFSPRKNRQESVGGEEKAQTDNKEDLGVSEYFKDGFTREDLSSDESEYLKNDPFKDKCTGASGDEAPSVSSNTVCLR